MKFKFIVGTITAIAVCALVATAGEKKAGAAGDKPKYDAEAAFKKLDTDPCDGKLSLAEFKANPRFKGDASKAEEAFKAKDKDKDGSLSLDEFKAHGPGHGKKHENK